MKLAFIGGNGHHYLKGLLTDGDHQPEATAWAGDGHDNDGAGRSAKAAGVETFFDDPAEMLDTFKPDIVNVGAMYAHNGDMIALCLERGIPVVSDKPIAASWPQLERIKALSAKNPDAPIVTEFDFHSRPDFRAARQVVRDGLIGPIALATAQKSYRFGGSRPDFYRRRADYGGTLLWVASHGIDAIHFVTGLGFVSVSGRQGNVCKPDYDEMEDHTASLFALEGGATGIVHADFLRPAKAPTHGDDRLRVIGRDGQLEVRDGRCIVFTQDREAFDASESMPTAAIHVEMLAALRGESSDLYGTGASLSMAAVLLASRDAADTGRTIELG